MSDHHVVYSTVLSTLSSSFSAYFKKLELMLILSREQMEKEAQHCLITRYQQENTRIC